MPGFMLNPASNVLCPHGMRALVVPSQARVLVDGLPATTVRDQYLVAGCPFTSGTAPMPCVRVQWVRPAARVLVDGAPALLIDSGGIGVQGPGVPNGPMVVASTQARVAGS
ncbi:MAG: DUF4280 domain-containing protein [Deltaproteobacteria bacterium]|nr:DUF4280 domain-containing protein [Deltaproteobacteria bacterium]